MIDLIKTLSETLRSQNIKMATAESCTGGMISSAITNLAGSSDIFDRGFVTYSNQAKMDMLGVSPATLDQFGAVSEQTAREMALGAIKNSQADVAISVTGIAGPSGGTAEKPVGLVYIGIANKSGIAEIHRHVFSGSRSDVRTETTQAALQHLLDFI